MEQRRTWATAALGVVLVVIGLLVLRSPRAQASFGWFAYGPPSPEVLDGLVAWNLVRVVGALLVLLGLVVVARALGVLAARRGRLELARFAGRVMVLGALLVVGGVVGFFLVGIDDRGEATISISKFRGPQPIVGPSVWTRDQLEAALLAATGLVVIALGTGLRRGRTVGAGAS